MIDFLGTGDHRVTRPSRYSVLVLTIGTVGLGFLGCSAFNPAFVDLVTGDAAGSFSTIDNAPGHVVVTFINNAEVDERLVDYLVSTEGGGLTLTAAERRALKPRIRFRILVTFSNGTEQRFEFVDGSVNLIDQDFDAAAFPDLNQNDLDNAVVACDVARVELLPGSPVEVFVPVEMLAYELVEVAGVGGTQQTEFELRERISPQFRTLQQDDVDVDQNVLLQRNIGVRDMPAPVNPLCGSVVAIVLNGVLRVPFLTGVDDNPSYDREDQTTIAGIGGRYEFVVSVQ